VEKNIFAAICGYNEAKSFLIIPVFDSAVYSHMNSCSLCMMNPNVAGLQSGVIFLVDEGLLGSQLYFFN